MWRSIGEDAGYAFRIARRNPVVSLTIVLTVALGIGVTTAVFSVVNGVLLKPLPFVGSDRVVQLGMVLGKSQQASGMAYPDMLDFQRDSRSTSSIGYISTDQATLTQGADPQQVQVALVDSGYPSVFGLRTSIGRLFAANELESGGPSVVVLSDGFWRRQFGADPATVGRTISLDNRSYEVVGILAPGAYTYPQTALDVMLPLTIPAGSYRLNRGAMWLEAFATVRPGTELSKARADLTRIAERISHDYPASNSALTLKVDPLRDAVVGDIRPMLILLAASVAAVLLIACVNIANLLLGRSQGRVREFAVRAALGGSGSRLARQLFTESLALASAGGIAGVAIVQPMTRFFVALYPGTLPRVNDIAVDARVLVVAAAATLLAGTLSGAPLARRAFNPDLARGLRGGQRAGLGRGERRVGAALIGGQMALSLVLIFAAGLLLQTFRSLSRVNPGFAASQLTTFHLSPSPARHAGAPAVRQFYDNLETSLGQIPGVTSVAIGTDLPLGNSSFGDVFVDDLRGDVGDANPRARRAFVNSRFWSTLGVPVISGRTFTVADDSASPSVVVINKALAAKYYPGVDPIGRTISWNFTHWTIVGVVGGMRMDNLVDEPDPAFYAPSTQVVMRSRFVAIKSAAPLDQLIRQVRQCISGIDPTIAVTDIATMSDRLHETIAPQRFRAAMVAGLGLLALVLSIIGIYGVVAHDVGRQTRDIGIRMALGETARGVVGRVIAAALRPALAGAAVGVLLAIAARQWLASLLPGIGSGNIGILAAATGVMLTVAALAAYLPARRASRVDPLRALHSD